MEFFDKKEEVIDIQMTQYGKHLLSLGKFKPAQYAFFDNDIIYDPAYASGSEQQNKTEERIKEVPRTKAQYVFSGIETEVKKNVNLVRPQWHENWEPVYDESEQQVGTVMVSKTFGQHTEEYIATNFVQLAAEKNYSLMLPMGNSAHSSRYAPAWDLRFLHNSASVFVDHITGSHFKLVKVPQGEVQVTYKTYITDLNSAGEPEPDYLLDPEDAETSLTGDDVFDSTFLKQYGSDTTIQVEKDYIFLDVLEENVDFKKHNFDIEIFRVDEQNIEHQLFFLENSQAGTLEDNPSKANYVEWWLNIYTDNEIDPRVFCKTRVSERRKNIFADQFSVFDCGELEEVELDNIYVAELTDEDFEEPC
jgi:hypothetical protein